MRLQRREIRGKRTTSHEVLTPPVEPDDKPFVVERDLSAADKENFLRYVVGAVRGPVPSWVTLAKSGSNPFYYILS